MGGRSVIRALIGLLGLALAARAQVLLPPQDADAVNRLIDARRKDTLACEVETDRPSLDFAFRFEIRYVVRCPLREFKGEAAQLTTILRVHPGEGQPSIFVAPYEVPAAPVQLKSWLDLRRLHNEFEFSGAIAAGAGEYPIELVLTDGHERFFRHSWKATAELRRDELGMSPTLKPGTVMGMRQPFWERNATNSNSPHRLTVLLDAAPVNPQGVKLRAWDRSFLLNSLYSLLRHVPAAQVRLIAFNLDQQREVFRQEELDRFTFVKLAQALSDLELGTVSKKTLERHEGWAELLAGLIEGEATGTPGASAIIFLGPHGRVGKKMTCDAPDYRPGMSPRIFYFEYFERQGSDFPDSIEHLTNACKGRIFKLHSPIDLGRNIARMRADLGSPVAVSVASQQY
jgi:hypothetical protein